MKIFVSVGGTANDAQESFVNAVEQRLRSEGLIPQTVGRNTFSADAPLRAIKALMEECSGVVVIALERIYCADGIEKRGGESEKTLRELKIPTPWNHIEAAMGYSKSLPLMVIVESGLREDGLLEPGNDWYVQRMEMNESSLSTPQFNGILADWKNKLLTATPSPKSEAKDVSNTTIVELLGRLKPAELWSALGALAAVVAGAFAIGAKLGGGS